jgi:RNA polymerase sigma-70 factor (ECF subfamily)
MVIRTTNQETDMRDELAALGNGAHALAIQILGNRDDAADAVHDAFARVLARPQAWDRDRGPLRPWFLRVVRNQCIDLLRRRRPAGTAVEALVATGDGPDAALEALQRDRGLERALAELTEEHRQIIVLRDYLDLAYADIAAVLDIAPGTVMSRLHRARLALRERLEQTNEE